MKTSTWGCTHSVQRQSPPLCVYQSISLHRSFSTFEDGVFMFLQSVPRGTPLGAVCTGFLQFYNKTPQTRQLKTTGIYSLRVAESRSTRLGCHCGSAPSRGLREESFLLLRASRGCWQCLGSLDCGPVVTISASTFVCPISPLCPHPLFLYKNTSH